MDFPLTSRRKTGFLPPLIGTGNNTGFQIETPFYWNMAPNRDYTFAPRLMARRGLQLNNEFRYLEPRFGGEARFDYLPDDRVLNESRWFGSLQHSQRFSDRLRGYLNLQGVSDDTYFTDLSNNVAATSQTNLPREGALTYNGDWWTLFGRVQEFQTLQNPDSPPVTPPYARVPQLALRAAQHNVGGFDLDFFGEVVNFQQTGLVSGWRQVYYPSASYPYRNRLFWVTPKLGFNWTGYTFNNDSQPEETRALPIFSVDSGMTFERNTALGGRAFRQTLEPRLYYVYIPFAEQNQLPVYDTAESDFNLAELFTENQFSGWDRINNANQISAALTSRLLDPNTGAEWIRGTLAQRYYFEPQEVTLGGPARTASRSDVLGLLTGSLTRAWSADFGVTYSLDQRQAQKLDVALRYRPQLGKVVNLGYRFTQDFLEQLDLSAQWPLSRRWSGVARWNYSLQDQSLLEALVGLEYTAGCWAVRLVGHKFVTAVGQDSTSLLFQFELSGLSKIGNNPLELLRQNIGGYTRAGGRVVPAGPVYPGMETE
jgi:LPS-assembly protein